LRFIWEKEPATGCDSLRTEAPAGSVICFTVIDASASVNPIITTTETHATALYAEELVHSFMRLFLLISSTM
jgi:hypothetical protein